MRKQFFILALILISFLSSVNAYDVECYNMTGGYFQDCNLPYGWTEEELTNDNRNYTVTIETVYNTSNIFQTFTTQNYASSYGWTCPTNFGVDGTTLYQCNPDVEKICILNISIPDNGLGGCGLGYTCYLGYYHQTDYSTDYNGKLSYPYDSSSEFYNNHGNGTYWVLYEGTCNEYASNLSATVQSLSLTSPFYGTKSGVVVGIEQDGNLVTEVSQNRVNQSSFTSMYESLCFYVPELEDYCNSTTADVELFVDGEYYYGLNNTDEQEFCFRNTVWDGWVDFEFNAYCYDTKALIGSISASHDFTTHVKYLGAMASSAFMNFLPELSNLMLIFALGIGVMGLLLAVGFIIRAMGGMF